MAELSVLVLTCVIWTSLHEKQSSSWERKGILCSRIRCSYFHNLLTLSSQLTVMTQVRKKPRWKNRIANNDRKDTNDAPVKQKPDLLQQKKRLIKMTAAAESWRFIAFFCFWAMCLFAITITRLIVVDKLAAGPKVEGDACKPFNQENPGLGQGFDFDSENHLLQQFGFSPICANWDYSPARELTAMFYPLFEYSLLIYLALDFYTMKLSYQRGESSKWFWTLTKIFFPIEIILTAWFRKLFYHHFSFSSMQKIFLHSQ